MSSIQNITPTVVPGNEKLLEKGALKLSSNSNKDSVVIQVKKKEEDSHVTKVAEESLDEYQQACWHCPDDVKRCCFATIFTALCFWNPCCWLCICSCCCGDLQHLEEMENKREINFDDINKDTDAF